MKTPRDRFETFDKKLDVSNSSTIELIRDFCHRRIVSVPNDFLDEDPKNTDPPSKQEKDFVCKLIRKNRGTRR
jgi:hypothetical protein